MVWENIKPKEPDKKSKKILNFILRIIKANIIKIKTS